MQGKPTVMYKAADALIKPLFGGLMEAAKRGLSGGGLAGMKKGFSSIAGPGTDAFTMARGMYHSPIGAFGDMTVGASAPTLKFLARKFLGAKGKWTNFDPSTGKSEFKFTGEYGKGDTFRERLGNSLYSAVSRAENYVNRHSKIANEAANSLKERGHGVAGFFGNKFVRDTGIGIGAPMLATLGTGLATGADSVPSKVVNFANEAYFAPFSYLNPFGLSLTALQKGSEAVGGFINKTKKDVENKLVATANESAHTTVDRIADELANGGRAGFMYGAISPESWANNFRARAHREVDGAMPGVQQYIAQAVQNGGRTI